eukprot:2717338-Prorocentrum_lima.AAC.1
MEKIVDSHASRDGVEVEVRAYHALRVMTGNRGWGRSAGSASASDSAWGRRPQQPPGPTTTTCA